MYNLMIWHGWTVYKILYSHMQYTLYILCVWDCRWSTYAIVKIQCSWLFTMVFRRGSQFVPGNSCTRLNRNRAIIKEKKTKNEKEIQGACGCEDMTLRSCGRVESRSNDPVWMESTSAFRQLFGILYTYIYIIMVDIRTRTHKHILIYRAERKKLERPGAPN